MPRKVRKQEHRTLQQQGIGMLGGTKWDWLYNRDNLPPERELRFEALRQFDLKTVRGARTIWVPLSQDSHVIAVAWGEGYDLSGGYGSSYRDEPLRLTNPIWVDVDDGGFAHSYDDLGYDLPVKGRTVEEVKALLGGIDRTDSDGDTAGMAAHGGTHLSSPVMRLQDLPA